MLDNYGTTIVIIWNFEKIGSLSNIYSILQIPGIYLKFLKDFSMLKKLLEFYVKFLVNFDKL